MLEDAGESLNIKLLAGGAIGGGCGGRKGDSLDGSVSLKLANHFLATSVSVEDLTEKSPEGVLFGEQPSAAHHTDLLWFEKCLRNELIKDLADLFNRLLLQQSQLVSKFLCL